MGNINANFKEQATGETPVRLVDYIGNLRSRVGSLEAENVNLNMQLRRDDLTELPNQRAFREELKFALEVTKITEVPFSVLSLDLDGFKGVNDRFSRRAGDDGLKRCAEVVKNCLRQGDGERPSDMFARITGDEFAAIIWGANEKGAEAVIERIRAECEKIEFPYQPIDEDGKPDGPMLMLAFSSSIGVATWRKDMPEGTDLFQIAEVRMKKIKAANTKERGAFAFPPRPISGTPDGP